MARAITPDRYAELIEKIRRRVPEIAITTDIMVGFPGENEEEFNRSLEFILKMNFSEGHVFTYSAREGTRAAEYTDQVPFGSRKKRSAMIREILSKSSLEYRKGFLGHELPVLWERVEDRGDGSWKAYGLTDNYLRVEVDGEADLWNTISTVKLIGLTKKGLQGELLQT
jgi:threonylcarbamoyladenosine tRNA methylthiotransferase MtaB